MNLTQLNNPECPNCGGTLEQKYGAAILECPYCGAKFKDESAPQVTAVPVPANPAPAKPAVSASNSYAAILQEALRGHTINPKSNHAHIGLDAVAKQSYKLKRARENFNIPASENCYLLYTDGSSYCDKGFAVCDTGVYYLAEYGKNAGTPQHLTLPQFEKAQLSNRLNTLYINEDGFYIYDETGIKNMLELLKKLQRSL